MEENSVTSDLDLFQGRHFNFFEGGKNIFLFFNATCIEKLEKNSTLYVVM